MLLSFVYLMFRDEEHGGPAEAPVTEAPVDERLGDGGRTLVGSELGTTGETSEGPMLEPDRPGSSRGRESVREDPTRDETESAVPAPRSVSRSKLVFTVEDMSERPLPGIRLSLRSRGVFHVAETGSGGEASFSGLPGGAYSYLVHAPDERELASAVPIQLRDGEEKSLTLRLGSGGLSISGRVLNRDGEPVPGIALSAVPYIPRSSVGRLVASGERSGWTGGDGSYEIRGLEAGEYEVRTTATNRYPSARIIRWAGADSADIVLVESQKVRVYGTVTDTRGEPLAGVQVVAPAESAEKTRTDDDGNYELYLVAHEDKGYDLAFLLQGYHAERPRLMGRDLAEAQEMRLDVQLEVLGEITVVSGTLMTERGDPIAGERIQLSSPLLKTGYSAVSDEEGGFRIPNVEIGSDYQLFIWPRGAYQDYSRENLAATRGGLFLEIVLESLASARLAGRMIDADENPLPSFRLWLWSMRARGRPLPVSTDSDGYFVVEQAPEGPLRFGTRSRPHLEISGINLAAGDDAEVVLVVDWGEHVLSGEVLDDRGSSLAGARVQLSWMYAGGGIQSTSLRSAVTDNSGFFRFTQLGPGPHTLNVSVTGYHGVQERYEVGEYSEPVEVQLDPISP
jgi:protocatechuate 3,4-dioxygenase beta subunit